MSRLICKFQVVGPVQTNCYFLYREDTKDCVIVDPGDEAKRIKKFIGITSGCHLADTRTF